jgi:hypothetical protein
MPFCPSCKSFVPPGVPTCPKDGTSLNSKPGPPAPLTGPRPALAEQTKEVAPEPVMEVPSEGPPAEDDHTPNEEPVMSTMRMEALDLSSQPELLLAETDEPTPADASLPEIELIEESHTPSEESPLLQEEDAIAGASAEEPKTENNEADPKLPDHEEPSIKELPAPPPPPIGVVVAEMKRDEDLAATSRLPSIAAPKLEEDAPAPKPLSLPLPIGLPLPASISTATPIPPAPMPIAIPTAPPPAPLGHTPPPIPLSALSSPPPLPSAGAPVLPPPVPFSTPKPAAPALSTSTPPPPPPLPKKPETPILNALSDATAEPPAPFSAPKPSASVEIPPAPLSKPSTPVETPAVPLSKPSASVEIPPQAAPEGRPMAPPGRPMMPPGRVAPSSAATPPEGVQPSTPPRSAATPPEGTPVSNHSMRTPPEGNAVVADGGRPSGPPGRPPGRPAPAPMPTKAPLPMRAAPLPPRMQKSEDVSSTSRLAPVAAPKPQAAPPPKLDYNFPPAKNAPFPEINVEWTIRVPSDAQEPGNVFACAGADDVALAWHDRRQKKRYEVYAARFGQRSQKRGPGVSIVPKPGPALNPAICWDGIGYGLFWQDGRKGNADIYYRHLDKELKPDGKELRLTDGKAESMNPRVLWNGNEFVCAYAKQIGDVCEIYLMRVARDGSLIGTGEMQISEGNRNALNPSICFSGDSYGLAWEDFRNDRGHIYFCRLSTDGGRFSYDQRVSVGKNGVSNTPSIAHNGDNFAIAWIEWPDDMRQNNAIHFAKVTNRGNLNGEIHRVVTEKAIQGPPTLLWRESEYVVIWQDSREGAPQIFAQRIDPDGVRIGGETRLSNGEGASLFPWAVPGANNQIAVSWHSETPETGGYEIFGTMLSLAPLPE